MHISDTVQMMGSYTDVVVIRHPQPGAVGVSISTCRLCYETIETFRI